MPPDPRITQSVHNARWRRECSKNSKSSFKPHLDDLCFHKRVTAFYSAPVISTVSLKVYEASPCLFLCPGCVIPSG